MTSTHLDDLQLMRLHSQAYPSYRTGAAAAVKKDRSKSKEPKKSLDATTANCCFHRTSCPRVQDLKSLIPATCSRTCGREKAQDREGAISVSQGELQHLRLSSSTRRTSRRLRRRKKTRPRRRLRPSTRRKRPKQLTSQARLLRLPRPPLLLLVSLKSPVLSMFADWI